jgi:hypothetical protein
MSALNVVLRLLIWFHFSFVISFDKTFAMPIAQVIIFLYFEIFIFLKVFLFTLQFPLMLACSE